MLSGDQDKRRKLFTRASPMRPDWAVERDETGQAMRMVLTGWLPDRPSRGVRRSTGLGPCNRGGKVSVEQIDWIADSASAEHEK
jgi:hypothetical protein